jgi:MerR family transcriptional regulator, copper efflux regulator
MTKGWSVGELATQSGVPSTTLRYYDRIGLLVPDRGNNGHRRYGPRSLHILRTIQLAQAVGCSLDEIQALVMPGAPDQRQELAQLKLQELQKQQHQLALAEQVLGHLAECRHTPLEATECQQTILTLLAELGDGLTVPNPHKT